MRAIAALLLGTTTAAAEVSCHTDNYAETSFSICEVSASSHLALFLRDDSGSVLGTFEKLAASQGGQLVFAMNGGMYHDDRSPVGLFRKDNVDFAPLITSEGPGNFGMLPNGVFCIHQNGAFSVIETLNYATREQACRDATQSGPMLLIDGELHPRFIPDGTSRRIRNGVGVTNDGQSAHFVISDQPVNFHDFASLFKDQLGLSQALYFDGNISKLHAAELGRSDKGLLMGPILAVIDPAGD